MAYTYCYCLIGTGLLIIGAATLYIYLVGKDEKKKIDARQKYDLGMKEAERLINECFKIESE